MNQLTMHIPAFVDYRDTAPVVEFSTMAELEAIPWVDRWRTRPYFLRFSKSDEHMMAEFSPSEESPAGQHYVIGNFRDPAAVDLPQWVETPAQTARREAWNRGETGI